MSQRLLFPFRSRTWTRTVVRSVKRVPIDLLAIAVYVGVVGAVFAFTGSSQRLLRAVVGLPLVLILPGYALVAVFFPGDGSERPDVHSALGTGERVALSFGMSLALLPMFVLVVELVSTGMPTMVVLATVSVFVFAGAIVGAVRRLQLPPERRFELPVGRWFDELYGSTVGANSRLDALVTSALLISVVIATATLGYALVAPTSGEAYTSFSVLAENEDGQLVAAEYPDELVQGEDHPLVASIENGHDEAITYTLVVELQAVETDGSTAVVEREEELVRTQVEVDGGVERRVPHAITPSLTGEDLRLQYYLYEGDAPTDASASTADDRLFLWVNVSEPE